MNNFKRCSAWLAAVGLMVLPKSGVAAGFALNQQSVKGLGNAFAGSAATAEDAGTLSLIPRA